MTRERLCGLLWSGRGAGQGRASLRQSLHELNTALGQAAPLLVAPRDHSALRGPGLDVAVDHGDGLTRLLEELDGIDAALDRFLDERRQEHQRQAVARVEAVLAARQVPQERLAAAEAVLALDPAHEVAWRAAIIARAELGARAEALATYDRCVAALASRLGAAPSAATLARAGAGHARRRAGGGGAAARRGRGGQAGRALAGPGGGDHLGARALPLAVPDRHAQHGRGGARRR
jgi:DNA-binding SARP family transcriptional activator